jgi:hypothetical protein
LNKKDYIYNNQFIEKIINKIITKGKISKAESIFINFVKLINNNKINNIFNLYELYNNNFIINENFCIKFKKGKEKINIRMLLIHDIIYNFRKLIPISSIAFKASHKQKELNNIKLSYNELIQNENDNLVDYKIITNKSKLINLGIQNILGKNFKTFFKKNLIKKTLINEYLSLKNEKNEKIEQIYEMYKILEFYIEKEEEKSDFDK